jgi:FtsP/CotA-like multicopper oxidase with cupredoxin domain
MSDGTILMVDANMIQPISPGRLEVAMDRRTFIACAGSLLTRPVWSSILPEQAKLISAANKPKPYRDTSAADHTLKIEPCTLEISPGVNVKTVAYNGQVPGPILRLREGRPANIDVLNASSDADIVHWHGLTIDSFNDGAMEEGSPMIPAGGRLRYGFTPRPAGVRWYHTHAGAGSNLSLGTYTGQFGFLLVEGKQDPGRFDQEVFLAIHHWEPSFVPMAEKMQAESANMPSTSGADVGYKYATINQPRLGAGEPIRVKAGQRVLMHFLNASATENVVLAMPGHTFKVIAMDGNPVPNPAAVEVLSLAVAERIDAIVEMNSPGVWVLGSTLEKSRAMGLGVVIEYAGRAGAPVWKDPAHTDWDYAQFASSTQAQAPDETISLTFSDEGTKGDSKFDTWAINGKSWPHVDPIHVKQGKRYRLVMNNSSGDQHPMHLHRHNFEVVQIGDKKLSGLKKDVVNIMPLDTVAVDFVADNPGNSLFHCHMQLHMDFGFMQMIQYTG